MLAKMRYRLNIIHPHGHDYIFQVFQTAELRQTFRNTSVDVILCPPLGTLLKCFIAD